MNPLRTTRLSVTSSLILINVVVFIAGLMARTEAIFTIPFAGGQNESIFQVFCSYSYFATVMEGQWWRVITYQFVHANLGHIFFNMLALHFFGPAVEHIFGPRRFLAFYLICGVSGAIFASLLGGLGFLEYQLPQFELITNMIDYEGAIELWQLIPMVGASAAVYGVLIATAFMFPRARVQLLFPPINLSLRTLAIAIVAIASLTVNFNGHNAGGEAGHLGGIICSAIIMLFLRKKLYRMQPW